MEHTLLLIRDLLKYTGIGLDDIPSIGIGCVGTIDYVRGIVKYAKNLLL